MKKKILLMNANLGGGGAEKVLIDLVHFLDKEKYDITVYTLFNEGVYLQDLPACVSYCSVIKNPTKTKKAIFWRLLKYLPPQLTYRLFVRGKYDTEIAFAEGLPTILLSGSPCKNKIAWVHCDLLDLNWVSFYYRSDKHQGKAYRSYKNVVFVSRQAKSAFQKRFGILGTETIIYNLIDSEGILKKAEESVPKRDSTIPVICAVGRLISVKGFMRLLSVHKRLISEGILNHLWICGEGADKEQMEAFIRENNLEDSVSLWGFQKNPYKFIKAADAYVCSSLSEGFSLTVAEAMILSCPVISARSVGPEELLQNGRYGLLVENSEEGLYEGIRSVLTDRALLEELKQKSILGAKQFDANVIVRKIEELL